MQQSQQHRILLVDDDLQALESTRRILELSGYSVSTALDGQAALDLARASSFDLVVTDVRMPRMGGLEFLRAMSLCGQEIPIILMTAFGRVEDAVWAMKLGAVDFLTKPFKRQQLVTAVETALKRAGSRGREFASGSAVSKVGAVSLIGDSAKMRELFEVISQVAPTHATVLITGESGTGKELVARSLHERSARSSKNFVPINCAAIPESLLESELFGFEKGAFSGATQAKEGLFEAADGGTLLLDEIGDMPVSIQAKFLRVLQEGEVRRLGATSARKINVRVLAATHRDLHERVRAGAFRQDLLFRLEVIHLFLPKLSERIEDIPELACHFSREAARRHDKKVTGIHESTMNVLLAHSWPGNIRELSNVIERAVVFSRSERVMPHDLPPHLLTSNLLTGELSSSRQPSIEVKVGTPLREVEDLLIRKTLEATQGDKNMAAKLLGVNSRTIYRKLDKRPEEVEV